jgi:hypothetical protein
MSPTQHLLAMPDCRSVRSGRRAGRPGRWWRRGGLALAVLASGCAQLAPQAPADPVERFAGAYTRLLPVGRLLDASAAQDARWPLADKAELVSAAQLDCMRGTLSSGELLPRQRQLARDYARAHPDALASELQVLEAGAARLIGEAMLAGAGLLPVAAPATPAETEALAAFVTQPRFAGLRRATGLEHLAGAVGAPADPRQRGRTLGRQLLTRFMTDAFVQCHIPVKLLY